MSMVSINEPSMTVCSQPLINSYGGITFKLPAVRHMLPPRLKHLSYQAEMHTMLDFRLLMQEH